MNDGKSEPWPEQSYGIALRNGLLDAALRLPAFAGFKRRLTKQLPTQRAQMPTLGGYFIDEVSAPEGDGNTGELVFVSTTRIGFSAIFINSDVEDTEDVLDRLFMALMNGLWRDPYLTSLIDTYNPHLGQGTALNARFEAIPRIMRRHNYGAIGGNNETPFAELQCEVSLFHRCDYPPTIEDELLEVDFRTAIGFPDQDKVQQVHVPIHFARPKERELSDGNDDEALKGRPRTR
jgi:hypothetical protein